MSDVLDSDLARLGVPPGPAATAMRTFLADPAHALLALDFDGTLSPIIDQPERAEIHPESALALDRIGRQIGTIAIITGRPARAAVALGRLDGIEGLRRMVVLGQYGAERWDAESGSFSIPPIPQGIDEVHAAVHALVSGLDIPGVAIEHKGRAVGIHWRNASDPQRATSELLPPAREIAQTHGFHLEPGKAVLEIRPPGRDKGMALAELVRERGATSVIFGGDDLGDLPAFDEIERERREGVPGLLLASGSAEQTALAERADVVKDGPQGIAEWLIGLAEALERRAGSVRS